MTPENKSERIFSVDDVRLNQDQASKRKYKEIIEFDSEHKEQKIVLFNPNLNKRDEVVSFRVNTPNVDVYTADGQLVKNSQVSLVWPNTDGGYLKQNTDDNKVKNLDDLSFASQFEAGSYELLFQVSLESFSVSSFSIVNRLDKKEVQLTKVRFYYQTVGNESLKVLNENLKKRYLNSEKIKNIYISRSNIIFCRRKKFFFCYERCRDPVSVCLSVCLSVIPDHI